MGDRPIGLVLDLAGNLTLTAEDGTLVEVSGKGERAILAMVATARDMRRARDWLAANIWDRTDSDHARSSLRSALRKLRIQLGPYAACLHATDTHVALRGVRMAPLRPGETAAFFEDHPRTLGEPFEDWLRDEAQAFQRRMDAADAVPVAPAPDPAPQVLRPCLVVLPVIVMPESPDVWAEASRSLAQIVGAVSALGAVEIVDLRDFGGDGSGFDGVQQPACVSRLRFSVLASGDSVSIEITIRDAASYRLQWGRTLTVQRGAAFSLREEDIFTLQEETVDWVYRIFFQSRDLNGPGGTDPYQLMAAVHGILGMARPAQSAARQRLEETGLVHRSAPAAAWHCFSYANSVGETDPTLKPEMLEDLDARCAAALEIDPTNPLAMAVIAHVRGFVLRQLGEAADLLANARRASPNMALIWDLSAMNALYRDDVATAHRFARRAQAFGRFSPYRPLYESSLAITAAAAGAHEEAVLAGERVLSKMPDFVAVMRHVSASHAALGDTVRARSMLADIGRLDPDFGPEALARPDYPLPSPSSVELIRTGFQKVGLLRA